MCSAGHFRSLPFITSSLICVLFFSLQFKTKMQIQIIQAKSTGAPMLYRNVFNAGYLITKTYGIRGFYQGLQATWCRNVPAFGVFFGT